MTLRSTALALFAVTTLVLAACGGGDDEETALPPSGTYRFDVTGTMEVEFPAEGVSIAPTGQGAETGDVSGSLTSILQDDGTLIIPDLGLAVTFGDTTVQIGPADESMGMVGPDGATLDLNTEATLSAGEVATSDGLIQLESDEPFPGEGPWPLTPPEGWGSLPFKDEAGSTVFTISDVTLDLTLTEGPPADTDNGSSDGEVTNGETSDGQDTDGEATNGEAINGGTTNGEATNGEADGDGANGEEDGGLPDTVTLPDPEGEATECDTGNAVDDPAVDILAADVIPTPKGVEVAVRFAEPPTDTFEDFSFTVIVLLDSFDFRMTAIAQLHAGEEQLGFLEDDGSVQPDTEEIVRLEEKGLFFSFPQTPGPGDVVDVQSFHIETEGGTQTCDVLSLAIQGS